MILLTIALVGAICIAAIPQLRGPVTDYFGDKFGPKAEEEETLTIGRCRFWQPTNRSGDNLLTVTPIIAKVGEIVTVNYKIPNNLFGGEGEPWVELIVPWTWELISSLDTPFERGDFTNVRWPLNRGPASGNFTFRVKSSHWNPYDWTYTLFNPNDLIITPAQVGLNQIDKSSGAFRTITQQGVINYFDTIDIEVIPQDLINQLEKPKENKIELIPAKDILEFLVRPKYQGETYNGPVSLRAEFGNNPELNQNLTRNYVGKEKNTEQLEQVFSLPLQNPATGQNYQGPMTITARTGDIWDCNPQLQVFNYQILPSGIWLESQKPGEMKNIALKEKEELPLIAKFQTTEKFRGDKLSLVSLGQTEVKLKEDLTDNWSNSVGFTYEGQDKEFLAKSPTAGKQQLCLFDDNINFSDCQYFTFVDELLQPEFYQIKSLTSLLPIISPISQRNHTILSTIFRPVWAAVIAPNPEKLIPEEEQTEQAPVETKEISVQKFSQISFEDYLKEITVDKKDNFQYQLTLPLFSQAVFNPSEQSQLYHATEQTQTTLGWKIVQIDSQGKEEVLKSREINTDSYPLGYTQAFQDLKFNLTLEDKNGNPQDHLSELITKEKTSQGSKLTIQNNYLSRKKLLLEGKQLAEVPIILLPEELYQQMNSFTEEIDLSSLPDILKIIPYTKRGKQVSNEEIYKEGEGVEIEFKNGPTIALCNKDYSECLPSQGDVNKIIAEQQIFPGDEVFIKYSIPAEGVERTNIKANVYIPTKSKFLTESNKKITSIDETHLKWQIDKIKKDEGYSARFSLKLDDSIDKNLKSLEVKGDYIINGITNNSNLLIIDFWSAPNVNVVGVRRIDTTDNQEKIFFDSKYQQDWQIDLQNRSNVPVVPEDQTDPNSQKQFPFTYPGDILYYLVEYKNTGDDFKAGDLSISSLIPKEYDSKAYNDEDKNKVVNIKINGQNLDNSQFNSQVDETSYNWTFNREIKSGDSIQILYHVRLKSEIDLETKTINNRASIEDIKLKKIIKGNIKSRDLYGEIKGSIKNISGYKLPRVLIGILTKDGNGEYQPIKSFTKENIQKFYANDNGDFDITINRNKDFADSTDYKLEVILNSKVDGSYQNQDNFDASDKGVAIYTLPYDKNYLTTGRNGFYLTKLPPETNQIYFTTDKIDLFKNKTYKFELSMMPEGSHKLKVFDSTGKFEIKNINLEYPKKDAKQLYNQTLGATDIYYNIFKSRRIVAGQGASIKIANLPQTPVILNPIGTHDGMSYLKSFDTLDSGYIVLGGYTEKTAAWYPSKTRDKGIELHEFGHWLHREAIIPNNNSSHQADAQFPDKIPYDRNINEFHLGYINDFSISSLDEGFAHFMDAWLRLQIFEENDWMIGYSQGSGMSYRNLNTLIPVSPFNKTKDPLNFTSNTLETKTLDVQFLEENAFAEFFKELVSTGRKGLLANNYSWIGKEIFLPEYVKNGSDQDNFNKLVTIWRDYKIKDNNQSYNVVTIGDLYQALTSSESGFVKKDIDNLYLGHAIFHDRNCDAMYNFDEEIGNIAQDNGFYYNFQGASFKTQQASFPLDQLKISKQLAIIYGQDSNTIIPAKVLNTNYSIRTNKLRKGTIGSRYWRNYPEGILNSNLLVNFSSNIQIVNNNLNIQVLFEDDYKDYNYQYSTDVNNGQEVYIELPFSVYNTKMILTTNNSRDYAVIDSNKYWQMVSAGNIENLGSVNFTVNDITQTITTDEILKLEAQKAQAKADKQAKALEAQKLAEEAAKTQDEAQKAELERQVKEAEEARLKALEELKIAQEAQLKAQQAQLKIEQDKVAEIAKLEAGKQAEIVKNQKLAEENTKLQAKLADYQKQIDSLNAKLTQTQSDLATVRSQKDDIFNQKNTLVDDLVKAREENKVLDQISLNLKQTVLTFQEQLKNLYIAYLSGQESNQQERLNSLQQKKELLELTDTNTEIKEQLEDQLSTNSDLEQQNSDLLNQIENQNDQITKDQITLNQLQSDLTSTQDKLTKIQTEKADLEKQNSDLKNQIAKAKENHHIITQINLTLQKTISDLQLKLKEQQQAQAQKEEELRLEKIKNQLLEQEKQQKELADLQLQQELKQKELELQNQQTNQQVALEQDKQTILNNESPIKIDQLDQEIKKAENEKEVITNQINQTISDTPLINIKPIDTEVSDQTQRQEIKIATVSDDSTHLSGISSQTITQEPLKTKTNQELIISADNFQNTDNLKVYLDDKKIAETPVLTDQTDLKITVPDTTLGAHTITVKDDLGNQAQEEIKISQNRLWNTDNLGLGVSGLLAIVILGYAIIVITKSLGIINLPFLSIILTMGFSITLLTYLLSPQLLFAGGLLPREQASLISDQNDSRYMENIRGFIRMPDDYNESPHYLNEEGIAWDQKWAKPETICFIERLAKKWVDSGNSDDPLVIGKLSYADGNKVPNVEKGLHYNGLSVDISDFNKITTSGSKTFNLEKTKKLSGLIKETIGEFNLVDSQNKTKAGVYTTISNKMRPEDWINLGITNMPDHKDYWHIEIDKKSYGDISDIAATELKTVEGSERFKYRPYYLANKPWCATFVTWVYQQAGYLTDLNIKSKSGPNGEVENPATYTPAMWDYMEQDPKNYLVFEKGDTTHSPLAGDIVFFDYNLLGGDTMYKKIDHVGIVYDVLDNGTIITIEGNNSETSGSVEGVFKHTYQPDDPKVIGFGRPKVNE